MKQGAAIAHQIERFVIKANLTWLSANGVAVIKVDDLRYEVAGRFVFFPANGFWRAHDGSVSGYGSSSLLAEAWLGHVFSEPSVLTAPLETPAGSDSGATDRNSHDFGPDTPAEPAGVPSSSKLARPTL